MEPKEEILLEIWETLNNSDLNLTDLNGDPIVIKQNNYEGWKDIFLNGDKDNNISADDIQNNVHSVFINNNVPLIEEDPTEWKGGIYNRSVDAPTDNINVDLNTDDKDFNIDFWDGILKNENICILYV